MSEVASETKEIADFLRSNGWREGEDQFRPTSRMFYKRHDSNFRCSGNSHHEGVQVSIYLSDIRCNTSIELELCAGLSDGTWLKMLNYCLPRNIHYVIGMIPRMIATWEAANLRTPEKP